MKKFSSIALAVIFMFIMTSSYSTSFAAENASRRGQGKKIIRNLASKVKQIFEELRDRNQGNTGTELADLDEFLRNSKTFSFLMIENGEIVYEKYFNGGSESNKTKVFSAGKSITAVMFGIAQKRGLLKLSDPVSKYLPGWSKAPKNKERKITIEHVLSMTSGLNERRVYQVPAGTKWMYNTETYYVLHELLEKVYGKRMNQIANQEIFYHIDAKDQKFIGHTWEMTAKDLGKFGQLVLQNGKWDKKQIIPADFLNASLNSSQRLNPAYGYLWWLNGKSSFIPADKQLPPQKGSLIPAAPADMVCALGSGDKKCYVVPSLNMVVVRLGDSAGGNQFAASSFDNQLWGKLMKIIGGSVVKGPRRAVSATGGM